MNGLTWLLRLDLPSGTIHLTDGGVTQYAGDTYRAEHPVIGSVSNFPDIADGFGPELPEAEIMFAPPSNAALPLLIDAGRKRSPMRLWLAEYDTLTGAVVGTPNTRFIGNFDMVRTQAAFRQLSVSVRCVPQSETLFFMDDGNGLSSEYHKSLYPGETGHDEATGLLLSIYWGVSNVSGGSSFAGGGGGSGVGGVNGGGGEFRTDMV